MSVTVRCPKCGGNADATRTHTPFGPSTHVYEMSCPWCGSVRHGDDVLRLVQQAQLARANNDRVLRERAEYEARVRAERQAIEARLARARQAVAEPPPPPAPAPAPPPVTPEPEPPPVTPEPPPVTPEPPPVTPARPTRRGRDEALWQTRADARAAALAAGAAEAEMCASPWCANPRPTAPRRPLYCCLKCKDDVARRKATERAASGTVDFPRGTP